MSERQYYNHPKPFSLEKGGVINDLRIAYHTYGTLNEKKDNVVWICHALTANSDVAEWWGKIAGPEGYFNPKDHFIVCANILGSVYGTSNPTDNDPETGEIYGLDFPFFTMRDIVNAHIFLKEHLDIDNIWFCLGGSCGGQQVLEFAYMTQAVDNLMIIAASARETAWSVAIHSAQRLSLQADGTWGQKTLEAGSKGLAAARGIGLLGYRTFQAYVDTQTDEDDKVIDLKAESYIRYQGEKLVNRFNAYAYWYLTRALDSHHMGRGRGTIEKVLSEIRSKALVIGIDTDQLIPPSEQEFIAAHMPNALYSELKSAYGHDGFLIEQDLIVNEIDNFINSQHGI